LTIFGLFPPKRSDFSAIALGWSVLGSGTIKHAGSTFLGEPQSLLATRFGFAIEGLRDRRRPTSFAEKQNFHFELAALSSDLEELANMNGARRFD